jgi:hypothetical protein
MFKARMALAGVVVLSTVGSASAATRHHIIHARRTAIYNAVPGYGSQIRSDSNDPALTGGGSIGYNRMLLID